MSYFSPKTANNGVSLNLIEHRYPEQGREFRNSLMQWVKAQDFSEPAINNLVAIFKKHPVPEIASKSISVLCNNVLAHAVINGSDQEVNHLLEKIETLYAGKSGGYFDDARYKIDNFRQQVGKLAPSELQASAAEKATSEYAPR